MQGSTVSHKMRFVIFLNLTIMINCCEDFWKDWRNISCSPEKRCYQSTKQSTVEITDNTMTIMCKKKTIDFRFTQCLDTRNIQKLQFYDCYGSHFDVRNFASSETITEVYINNRMYNNFFESITFSDMPLLKTVEIITNLELVNITLNNVPSLNHLRVNKYSFGLYEDRYYLFGTLNISPELFNEIPNLQHLDLCLNNIESLHRSTFKKLTRLEYLDLGDNEIKNLPGKLLRGLTNLKFFSITGNKELNSISPRFLKGLINLTKFYAGVCSLSEIKENLFTDAINLKVLDLGENKIEHLPPEIFKNNQNLEEFSCDVNRISTLPEGIFDGLSKLRKIDLSKNQLENLRENAFVNLPSLEDLKLSQNRITSLPENIFFSLNNLRILVLSSNNLRSVSAKLFDSSKHLEYINLKNTSLNKFPEIDWTRYNLTYVDLSFNRFDIVKLPIYTPNYMRFKLSDCRIRTVYIDDRKYGFNTPDYDLNSNSIFTLKRFQYTD